MNNEPPSTPAPPASAWWHSTEKTPALASLPQTVCFHKQIPGLTKQHYKLEMLTNKCRTDSFSGQGNAGLTEQSD